MASFSIGIDTGGTFTDLVLADLRTGRHVHHKLPTTTGDPAKAVLDGIAELLQLAGASPGDVRFLVLGTTLATNAVLEGKCAPTGMITNAGFRDVLELARQRRPHYFRLEVPKPRPPATRDCRMEVVGRIAPDGSEVRPLDEAAVLRAIASLRRKKVEAVAVCMLHSYANPDHENRTAEIIRREWPEAYLCTSSDVLPEFREYERFATTSVNASLMPVMDRYLESFEKGVAALGIRVAPRVMQSNGGAVSPAAVRRVPVNTFFSGPAGGAIGCVGLAAQLRIGNLIAFDMGGTSTDVCLIRDGQPARKDLREIAGFPVRTRSIDIHTIGAGGGSIAWVDAGGLLKVGPQSAGAYPGPAAYGRGGNQPTVSDANVVLGRLNPRALLGGRMPMHADRARSVIDRELARRLRTDAVRAAAGILEIVNVNMTGAVRVISVEQGEDPRDFTLVAFGGAGPLHAVDVARNMGIRKVLVPPHPGLLSAIGLLHANVRGDFSLTRLVTAEAAQVAAINDGFQQLDSRGAAWLTHEAHAGVRAEHGWSIDMRYRGQNYELSLSVPGGRLDRKSLARLIASFHESHNRLYGYDIPGHPVEAVRLRLDVTLHPDTPRPEKSPRTSIAGKAPPLEQRDVWFPDTGFVRTPIYARDRLPVDRTLAGPAIVEQMDTTTVVPPHTTLRADRHGYLHLAIDDTTLRRSQPS